jgi:Ca2+/Na+ antiporter
MNKLRNFAIFLVLLVAAAMYIETKTGLPLWWNLVLTYKVSALVLLFLNRLFVNAQEDKAYSFKEQQEASFNRARSSATCGVMLAVLVSLISDLTAAPAPAVTERINTDFIWFVFTAVWGTLWIGGIITATICISQAFTRISYLNAVERRHTRKWKEYNGQD